jgi:hypothetical protein
MARRPTAQRGQFVLIRFVDHAEDGELFEFQVCGRVHRVTRQAIEVESWMAVDHQRAGHPIDDDNIKWFAIARPAIRSITQLVPAPAAIDGATANGKSD